MEATTTTQTLPMAIYNKIRHQSIERTIAQFETALIRVKGNLEVHNYAKADEMMSKVMDSAFVLCEQIENINKYNAAPNAKP